MDVPTSHFPITHLSHMYGPIPQLNVLGRRICKREVIGRKVRNIVSFGCHNLVYFD